MRKLLRWLVDWLDARRARRRVAYPLPRALAAKPKVARSSLATDLLARRPPPTQ